MEALESDLIISEESFESSFGLGLIYVEIYGVEYYAPDQIMWMITILPENLNLSLFY